MSHVTRNRSPRGVVGECPLLETVRPTSVGVDRFFLVDGAVFSIDAPTTAISTSTVIMNRNRAPSWLEPHRPPLSSFIIPRPTHRPAFVRRSYRKIFLVPAAGRPRGDRGKFSVPYRKGRSSSLSMTGRLSFLVGWPQLDSTCVLWVGGLDDCVIVTYQWRDV